MQMQEKNGNFYHLFFVACSIRHNASLCDKIQAFSQKEYDWNTVVYHTTKEYLISIVLCTFNFSVALIKPFCLVSVI